MGGIIAPKAPKPVAPVVEPEPEPIIEERDLSEVDRLRRSRSSKSLLGLLSNDGSSPTIL